MTESHRHDTDLVIELAEAGEDPAAASVRRRLDDCPRCIEELRLQRVALDALTGAPAATLNELEASRLRRNVAEQLGHRRATAKGAEVRHGIARWVPVMGAAAVVVAAVLVLPSLGIFGGAGDDMGGADVALQGDDDSSETTAAPEETEAPSAELFGTEESVDEMPALDQHTLASDDAGSADVMSADGAEALLAALDEILPLVERAEVADAKEMVARASAAYEPADDTSCTAEGSLMVPGPVISYTLGTVTLDADEVVLVTVHRDPGGATTLVAHDPVTCAVLQAVS